MLDTPVALVEQGAGPLALRRNPRQPPLFPILTPQALVIHGRWCRPLPAAKAAAAK
jgi:hypothetical protein